jgi:hypothetical protein
MKQVVKWALEDLKKDYTWARQFCADNPTYHPNTLDRVLRGKSRLLTSIESLEDVELLLQGMELAEGLKKMKTS